MNKKWLAIGLVTFFLGAIPIAIFTAAIRSPIYLTIAIGFGWGMVCLIFFIDKIFD